ncbi:profilin-4 isoform X2 [Erinaceus europaeus]|uniref:Profilin n=2 Tax=Erinaceus europaeus TaxID=9365 RepID=A0ABM3X1F4_ERIEU|nr:profilin-4 isoform X2 [Erinaceus europaeus]XP_060042652.1 profilin-4 isoform X2 [Erinaceus europaeus]
MSHLQTLMLDTLLGTKHVDSAALIKLHERTLCVASPGFSVMPNDIRTLTNGFAKNPLQARREGLYFKEKDYKCVRADDYSLYAKNENSGVIVVKTHMYLLVATYTEGMYPSVCVEATEKLGEFVSQGLSSLLVVLGLLTACDRDPAQTS